MAKAKKRTPSAKKRTGSSETWRGKFMQMLSLPESALPGVPYLELQGDTSLSITG